MSAGSSQTEWGRRAASPLSSGPRPVAAKDAGTTGRPHSGPSNSGLVPAFRCCRRSAGWIQSIARRAPAGAPKPGLADPTLGFPGWGIPWAPAGAGGGRKEGVSVGMSVAVLACWRPISQMILQQLRSVAGEMAISHQQGKKGVVHLGSRQPLHGEGTLPLLLARKVFRACR